MTGREHGGTGSLRFRLPRGCEPLTLKSLAQWLASLDEPGSTDRRTVTLTRIIDEARWALEGSGHDEQTEDPLKCPTCGEWVNVVGRDEHSGQPLYRCGCTSFVPDPGTVAAVVKWLKGRTGAHGGGFTSADDVADAIAREFGSSVSGGE